MSLSRNQLNEYLKAVDINGKICLDIGVQDKPTSRLTQGTPKKYYTTDIDPQWNPDMLFDLNDKWENIVTKIPDQLIKDEHLFDVVFCIEVLEHCWDPVRCVRNIANLLEPGGTAYISTPFINPHHDYVDYLRYTNEWYRDVLPKVGFSKVDIYERVASTGRVQLKIFFEAEGLRISRIRPEFGNYTYPIGYFVVATKGEGYDHD